MGLINIEFSDRELKLLYKIMSDKYSVGSFCGMIYNNIKPHIFENKNYEDYIKQEIRNALRVRIVGNDILKYSKKYPKKEGVNNGG